VHARQILAREAAFDVGVSAHAEEHGIELLDETLELDVAADLDIQSKFDAHALHDFTALLDDLLFQLERRNAEGQQSADLRIAIEDHRYDAVAHEYVGAAQARGSRADDRDALAGRPDSDMSGFQPI
jgi:hypothetical protein